jgi:hypothetical protein
MDASGGADEALDLVWVAHLPHVVDSGAGVLADEHPHLRLVVRVPDLGLHQEAVELCFRQRVRAVHLDRVLRRHHEERPRHR